MWARVEDLPPIDTEEAYGVDDELIPGDGGTSLEVVMEAETLETLRLFG